MRTFWVIVSWRLVPRVAGGVVHVAENSQSAPCSWQATPRAREPGEACPGAPARRVDRRGWV
jgi:hypothetical protein